MDSLHPYSMERLTLRQYSALDEMLKAFVLQVHGVYLEVDRMAEGRRVSLFSLFDFYVEVWYNEKETVVQYLVPFSTKQKLDPYLKQIELPDFIDP